MELNVHAVTSGKNLPLKVQLTEKVLIYPVLSGSLKVEERIPGLDVLYLVMPSSKTHYPHVVPGGSAIDAVLLQEWT